MGFVFTKWHLYLCTACFPWAVCPKIEPAAPIIIPTQSPQGQWTEKCHSSINPGSSAPQRPEMLLKSSLSSGMEKIPGFVYPRATIHSRICQSLYINNSRKPSDKRIGILYRAWFINLKIHLTLSLPLLSSKNKKKVWNQHQPGSASGGVSPQPGKINTPTRAITGRRWQRPRSQQLGF